MSPDPDDRTPLIPREVAEWLDRKYPERSPDHRDSEREIWLKAGERRLVRHVLLQLLWQEDNSIVQTT